MSKWKKQETGIEGAFIIEPTVFEDDRGFFFESYNKKEFEKIGIREEFVQDNTSKSKRGVLRGLHFQKRVAQGKLIRVVKGAIYDVIVDIRKNSQSYGKWYGIKLSAKNKKMLYIPKGFAHGFLSLEDNTEIIYKCTERYLPECERGIIYNDKELNINWKFKEFGIDRLILSEKDKKYKSFSEVMEISEEKVLITGANGQLGKEFIKLFDEKKIRYFSTDYNELDITEFDKVESFLEKNKISILINCVAYNDVDRAEIEKDKCKLLNYDVPKKLAEICKKKDIILLTYSTDFVFDGKKELPYTEEDEGTPLSKYGQTKYFGELEVLKNKKSYIIRTSWLFGLGNNNFCKQLINWSKEKNILKIVDDQLSSPTYAKDLAIFSWNLLQTDEFGLYHFSNSGEASKYEQAEYLLKKIGWIGRLERAKTEEFSPLAKRPRYSKLDSRKIEGVLKMKIPHWKEGIDRFLKELEEKK